MDVTNFLANVDITTSRFPYYLPVEAVQIAIDSVKQEHIDIYENALSTFLNTWVVEDTEILQQAINHLSLEWYIYKNWLAIK